MYRVLVVEDHLTTLQLVQSALESEDIEVRTAANGAECLLAIGERRPDLIVLDVVMPVMDGFQTLDVLQHSKETRDIPVIMLTARSSDLDVAQGWFSGVTSYLTKPFSIDQLMMIVRRVLEAGERAEGETADVS
jgi:DNA-binding response OmpR family regulator